MHGQGDPLPASAMLKGMYSTHIAPADTAAARDTEDI